MKLFNFNQSREQRAQRQHLNLVQLKKFAELSLLDSHLEKDIYLRDCLAAVAAIDFNSINGGIYSANNDYAIMSLEDNCIFAEFAIAAGHTFLNGDLNYLANQTLSALVTYLYSPEKKLFHQQLCYSIDQAPFVFDNTVLANSLSEEELLLLNTLIAKPDESKNSRHWISYRKSIIEASIEINYPPKKAQILEHSLRAKLGDFQLRNPTASQLSNEFCLSSNARMLSLLIQTTIWNKQNDYDYLIEDLKGSLLKSFNTNFKLNDEQTIDISFALLDYSQIIFKPSLVKQLAQKIEAITAVDELKQSYQTKLSLLISFLNQMLGNGLKVEHLSNSLNPELNETIKLVALEGTRLQQEKSKENRLACYNHFVRFISPY